MTGISHIYCLILLYHRLPTLPELLIRKACRGAGNTLSGCRGSGLSPSRFEYALLRAVECFFMLLLLPAEDLGRPGYYMTFGCKSWSL